MFRELLEKLLRHEDLSEDEAAAAMRAGVTASPSNVMPYAKAPTAPMPVQIMYALPSGSERIDHDSSPKLTTMAPTVTTLGHSRVKTCDCFMAAAQTTSSNPAMIKTNQAMRQPSFRFCRAVPVLMALL